jgi:TP901 family phage tail tape measure protein
MADLGTIRGSIVLDVRKAVAAYAALRAQNARTVYAMRGTGDSFVQSGQGMATAGAVMVYAFAKVVQAAAEFERKMDYASAVSGTTGQMMDRLGDHALDVAEKTIYSANEIADGFIELAKAGVTAEQIIGGIGNAMANLGAAGDIPLAQSGQIITSTIQQFDLAARDATKVTDLLAGAANASIADISDIGVSLKYVGGVANAAGLSFEDTSTAISLLAKAGIRGSTAGTSLRQMIVSLGGATGPARDALSDLGILAADGSNKFFDAQGNVKSLSDVFQILQNSTADLTNKQRLMYLRTIFNNRALSAASILTRDGAKGFKAMNKEMSKVTAAEVASERLDNLSGDIEILQGNIETMMVRAGGPFQEQMRQWVQTLTKLIQKFDELDPAMQKNIVKFVGLGGAALLAMGAFNIIVGTIFRFVASMMKMAAGVKFAASILKILLVNARWIAVLFGGPLVAAIGAISAPVWAVIGVIALLAAGFVIAYKKITPFRNAVNTVAKSIADGAVQIAKWFKTLVTEPGKAWAQLKKGTADAVARIGELFSQLGTKISDWVGGVLGSVGRFVSGVGSKIAALPGRVLGIITGMVAQVTEWLSFRNVGYVIGFMVGTVVRFFALLPVRIFSIMARLITGVIGFFAKLPAKIGYIIGFMIGKVIGFFIRLGARMLSLTIRAVVGVINFFAKLPGRIHSFLVNMVTRAIGAMVTFATNLPRYAAQAKDGIINFIQELPGRIATFLATMATRARQKLTEFKDNALDMARGMASGFMDAIRGLPGQVAGIADEIIQAFRDKITEAANAVRDFGRGMWDGFRDGIGMHSPSHFERAAWQITGVLEAETKKMAKKTMEVQKLSKKLAQTSFRVGDPGAPPSAQRYASLASMQSRNQNRARTLMAAQGGQRDRDRAPDDRRRRDRIVSGELDLTPSGRAFIRGVAEEVYDDNDSFQESTGRMDR